LGKRIYIKSSLLGYLFCEIFCFIIAQKNRQKFHKPVTLYGQKKTQRENGYVLLFGVTLVDGIQIDNNRSRIKKVFFKLFNTFINNDVNNAIKNL